MSEFCAMPPMRRLAAGFFCTLLLLVAGCHTRPDSAPEPLVGRFLLETDPARGTIVVLPVSGVVIHVLPKPVISEYDVVKIDVAAAELGPCLVFQLSTAAARDLYRLTVANPGRRLVLLLNDVPAGVRVIDRPLENGQLHLFCEVPDRDLPELSRRLQHTAVEIMGRAAKSK